jgi:hypothetical protein
MILPLPSIRKDDLGLLLDHVMKRDVVEPLVYGVAIVATGVLE